LLVFKVPFQRKAPQQVTTLINWGQIFGMLEAGTLTGLATLTGRPDPSLPHLAAMIVA
jgi:hypothetical protein